MRYSYLDDDYPIEDYQTVYATVPGSAEMASAGRPSPSGSSSTSCHVA